MTGDWVVIEPGPMSADPAYWTLGGPRVIVKGRPVRVPDRAPSASGVRYARIAHRRGPKPRVRLSDIVDAMEMQFDEMTTCLHRPTGRLVVVTDEARQAAEDGDDPGDHAWLAPEEVEAARELAEGSDDYVALPDRFELDEYRMMARFVRSVDDADARHDLERAIRGKGAFRYFKDTVHRLGLADAWSAHRERGYEEVARAWCEDNGIELEESRPES